MSDDTFDALGRVSISDAMKAHVEAAFQAVPPGKRAAVLIIADETGTRAHLAARINDHWKVAAGGGVTWTSPRPSGWIAVEGAW